MEEIEWLQMIVYQQKLNRFARKLLLHGQKQSLTPGEREILARLYLEREQNTPLALSKSSGMKKEAVSRCLKGLYEKKCVEKAVNPHDERSYIISVSEIGLEELRKDYELMLQPFYDLWRVMGDDFKKLFDLVGIANEFIDE